MILSSWILVAGVAAAVLALILLSWVGLTIIRHTRSGRYWIATWIPMGWLISLALVESLAVSLAGYKQILARYQQTPLTDLRNFYILWALAFTMVILGFMPQLRPGNRRDRLNLIMFSLCWVGLMVFVNTCWIAFMIIISLA
ncbi:hypothetical protein KEJ39_05865 [Candidatus Bathyarchaeota archaeon]|nr:hypothetical protein [Candidatus Bathyarchaeota archaeon]